MLPVLLLPAPFACPCCIRVVVHNTPHLDDFSAAIDYYAKNKGDTAWLTLLWEHKMWNVKKGDNWVNFDRKCDLAKLVMEHARKGGVVAAKLAPSNEIPSALQKLVTPKTALKKKRKTMRRDPVQDIANVPNAQSASACVSPPQEGKPDHRPNAQSASACVSPPQEDKPDHRANAQSASACVSPVKQSLCTETDPGKFARLTSQFHNAR